MDEFRGAELARVIAGCPGARPTNRWVEHPYGATRVPDRPRRAVSLGLDEHELLLHLGIVPLLVRDEWGDQPSAVWPWARHLLGGARPATFTGDEVPFDRIRALEPDLIVATWFELDAETYRALDRIAPTLPNPVPTDPWPQGWDEHFLYLAESLGVRRVGQSMVDAVRRRMALTAEQHPHWQGLVAASLTIPPDQRVHVDLTHQRGRLLSGLGFCLPHELRRADVDRCVPLDDGDMSPVDRDLIVWVNGSEDPDPIVRCPGRTDLAAHRDGREVYLDELYTAAFSVQSPLSLHFLLDLLVPEIEAAVDGLPHPPVSLSSRYGVAPVT